MVSLIERSAMQLIRNGSRKHYLLSNSHVENSQKERKTSAEDEVIV